jgi:signal transduction histidine kinase
MSLHVWEATGSPPAVWKEFVRRGASAGESVAIRPDGSRRELEGMARANVLPGRHLAVLRDVTERKELERELWRVQKLESVGRLAGGVAHDFNNLLTAIRGYAQLLEARTSVGSVEHHHAREIDRVADRAASLTAQLLALGRRQTMNVRPLDLNRRLEQMQESIVELAGDEIHVSFDLDPTLRPVRVDAGLLGQAVLNLVGNAVDAMPGGGHMLVRTANADVAGRDDLADGSYVVVSVHDEGVGIDPETLEHVFEPFFTTKAFGEGSGLGLASAYGTVRQSGGTITVDSTPGSGSTFSIWLPEATAASTGQPRPSAGETVLIIERDPAVRDVLFETLTDAGYRVLTTRTAVDAQRLIERYEDGIDLAIADLDHVRADALAGSAVRLLRLEKPFTPTRLHGAVRAALDDGLAVAG